MTYDIGIDPGAGANTGIAVVCDGRPVSLRTGTRAQAVAVCREYMHTGELGSVYVEDPRLIPTIYARNRRQDRTQLRIAQNVGQNKAVAAAIIEDLEAIGITPVRIAPSGAKWGREIIASLGWTARCSQHARDAYRVAVQGRGRMTWNEKTGFTWNGANGEHAEVHPSHGKNTPLGMVGYTPDGDRRLESL